MIVFLLTFILLAVYSFTRQDLNLTWYQFLPQGLIDFGWYFRPQATLVFVILSLILVAVYLLLVRHKLNWRWLIVLGLVGVFAYPMFSYDIFNYMFNAKMVLIYQANPHTRTAIEFAADPMLRFMQNVHTPAPYAYGWTLLSLIPGLAWFSGKFTLAFWAMKSFVVLFWLGQLWILNKLVKKLYPKESWRFWLFALNPLVIVETLINGHNDVVMMFLSLLSFWLLISGKKIYSLVALLFSAAIKYASVVLLPLYFISRRFFPTTAALLLFGVMFTRLDQLHSWYLIWAFSFAVLSKSKWLVSIFTALTIGALLRYAPYIYFGNWDPPVYMIRNWIWLGSLVFAPFLRRYLLK